MALTDAMFKIMDRVIGRLGYMKASDMPKLTHLLFAGEGATQAQGYITQTEAEAQRLAISNPWAYSNIMLISKRVAMGRMMVQLQDKAGEWQEDPLHEFTKIFEQQPNPYMGQMFIWMYQTFWLLLRGECYWMQVPDKTGKLTQVYPLPANRLEPIASEETLFSGFWYYPTATGTPKFLPPENVIFNRLPNPFNYNRGLSPLSAYYLGLQIDEEARRFELEDYQQGLTLKHILSLRPEVSDPDALRFKKEIDDAVLAGKRFMVVRGGDIKAAPLSARGGTDKESSNVRALTKMEADYVYNVPEGLRTSTATQANATVAERTFVADAIWPIMLLFTEDMTVQSVRKYYGDNQRARFEDPRIADKALAMQEDQHEWKYMTYDQVLESKGLDPYYNPEIGKQKFTVVDELIKMAFEQELVQNDREQELNDREQALTTQTAPEEDEGLEGLPELIPEAFLELEADIDSKVAKGSELYRWLEEGWLPDPFDGNGKHTAHNQLTHGRRYARTSSGDRGRLIGGKDKEAQRRISLVTPELTRRLNEHSENLKAANAIAEFDSDMARSIIGESNDLINLEKDMGNIAKDFGYNPSSMSQGDWLKLSDELETRTGRLLKFSTEERRVGFGQKQRGPATHFAQVGGKDKLVRGGAVSAKDAARISEDLSRGTKDRASVYLTSRLGRLGYDVKDVESLNLSQKRRLLAEVGHGTPQKTKISNISREKRLEIINKSSDKQRLESLAAARQPRTAEGLDTWELYHESQKRGGKKQPDYVPDELWQDTGETAPSFVTTAGG